MIPGPTTFMGKCNPDRDISPTYMVYYTYVRCSRRWNFGSVVQTVPGPKGSSKSPTTT